MIGLMDGWVPDPNDPLSSFDQYQAELHNRLNRLLKYRWFIGFNDRGQGHGDYAVMVRCNHRNIVVSECASEEIAEHIVLNHNGSLPDLVEEPPIKVICIDTSWEDGFKDDEEFPILTLGKEYDVKIIRRTPNFEDEYEIHFGPQIHEYLLIPASMFEVVK